MNFQCTHYDTVRVNQAGEPHTPRSLAVDFFLIIKGELAAAAAADAAESGVDDDDVVLNSG